MTESRPFIRLRGRSIMALVLSPEPPLPDWLTALDAQIDRSPNFFDGRPVIVDLGTLAHDTPDIPAFMRAIEARGIHIIGTEAAHPSWAGLEPWGRPVPGGGKPGRSVEVPTVQPKAPAVAAPPAPAETASLLVDRSLRSGQSITFEAGDVTIIGSVASGAEIVAGGSIHVYGALRGRAIAGLNGQPGSRIFCRKLHAELVAVDGVYQTADDMPAARIGAAACVWLDGDTMRITAID